MKNVLIIGGKVVLTVVALKVTERVISNGVYLTKKGVAALKAKRAAKKNTEE